jgi:hypothetical protein
MNIVKLLRKRATGAAASSLLTDLVSYWKLDETSGTRFDTVSSNNLSDNGGVGSAIGKIGNAAELDGTNYLSNNTPALLSTFEGNFSLSYWFNAGNQNRFPVSCGRTNNGFTTQIVGDFIAYYNGLSVKADDQDYTDNTWHHIVVTVDRSGNMELFTGGVSRSTVDISATSVPTISGFQVGRFESSFLYTGLVDEIGVWSRVLTASERTQLYNGGAGLTYPFV